MPFFPWGRRCPTGRKRGHPKGVTSRPLIRRFAPPSPRGEKGSPAPPLPAISDDRRRALALVPVSRETEERFAVYADLLARWQRIKNLVSPATLPEVWTRHLADSAQIVPLMPDALRWADIGSGAGFPGLVVAILLAGRPGAHVDLVEANARKCAFLREAARACGAPATVHNARIAEALPGLKSIEVLTARALAPLPDLLEMGKVLIDAGTTAVFLKSRAEVGDDAGLGADHEVHLMPSVTSPDGRILVVRRAAPPKGPSHE